MLAACSGGEPTTAPAAAPTPEPPAFDLAAVKAIFTDECKDPAVVDELFCEQVEIAKMRAEGTILNVPTTLQPVSGTDDRAEVICDQIVTAHFDAEGNDLGYDVVGVEARDGSDAAACTVDR
jgi:hypothetical protein